MSNATIPDLIESTNPHPDSLIEISEQTDPLIPLSRKLTINNLRLLLAGDVVTVTTLTHTLLATTGTLLVNDTAAGGTVTINLQSAAFYGSGFEIDIKKIGTDYNVIMNADGVETIDDKGSRTIHQHNDSYVLVSDGANWEIKSRNIVLGWAHYEDDTWSDVSPLELNSGNSYRAQVTIDGLGGSTDVSEWPPGVPEPWNTGTNKLVGSNAGDKFTYRLQFKAQDGASTTLVDAILDIGGGIGEISRRSLSVAKGASVETNVELFSTYFTGTTFVANGGTLYLDTSQTSTDMDIWDITLVIEKTHVAD